MDPARYNLRARRGSQRPAIVGRAVCGNQHFGVGHRSADGRQAFAKVTQVSMKRDDNRDLQSDLRAPGPAAGAADWQRDAERLQYQRCSCAFAKASIPIPTPQRIDNAGASRLANGRSTSRRRSSDRGRCRTRRADCGLCAREARACQGHGSSKPTSIVGGITDRAERFSVRHRGTPASSQKSRPSKICGTKSRDGIHIGPQAPPAFTTTAGSLTTPSSRRTPCEVSVRSTLCGSH